MAGRIPKVVVIGGIYIDIAIRCEEMPAPGQSVSGHDLTCTPTGSGLTEAAQAAICGCEVHLISRIGGGPLAEMVKGTLREYNINDQCIFTSEAKNTGTIMTLVNGTGENASCVYPGANSALMPRDIDAAEDIIEQADILLIHGQLLQETVIAGIRLANLHSTRVILDPVKPIKTPGEQGGRGSEMPDEYFTANIMIPNLYEAADIADRSTANINTGKMIGSELVARGVNAAVITMGKRGCMVVDREGADHIPAFNIELIDQTATGDAFAGALAAYCAVKDDMREAVKFASAAGALACTKFGNIESLPSKQDIIELLQQEDTEL